MHDTTIQEEKHPLHRMADENDAYAQKLEDLACEIDDKNIPRLSALVDALEDGASFFRTQSDELCTEADILIERERERCPHCGRHKTGRG